MGRKKLPTNDYLERIVKAIMEGKENFEDFEFMITSYGGGGDILTRVRKRLRELKFRF